MGLVGGVEEVRFLGFIDWDGVWDGAEGEEAVVVEALEQVGPHMAILPKRVHKVAQ